MPQWHCVYKENKEPDIVAHTFNHNTQNAEIGRCLWVQGQPCPAGATCGTLFRKRKEKDTEKRKQQSPVPDNSPYFSSSAVHNTPDVSLHLQNYPDRRLFSCLFYIWKKLRKLDDLMGVMQIIWYMKTWFPVSLPWIYPSFEWRNSDEVEI